jgi:hypothetical protein
MLNVLLTSKKEWKVCQIRYNLLDELITNTKIIYGFDNNSVTYAVLLEDSNDENILSSNILNRPIHGSVLFLKLENSQLVDMNQYDISNILKNSIYPVILYNEISQPVDELSYMVDNLEISGNSENIDDLQESDDIFDYFDNHGYDSNS